MTSDRAFVFSDIHLGPGNALTAFRDAKALSATFNRLADEPSPPRTELILAGDIFDFLQVDGYDGFSVEKAAERFAAIVGPKGVQPQNFPANDANNVLDVVAALHTLVNKPWCELTVLSGNHDPELMVPAVREEFERLVERRGSVRWADDEKTLFPGDAKRSPVHGRALGPADDVWITHGDRWDYANFIDRTKLAHAIRDGSSFALPAGSHLVFEVLAKIKPARSWVDELKPETGAVLPLLLYLDPKTTMDYLRKHYGLTARLFRGKIDAALRRGPLMGPEASQGQAIGAQTAADLVLGDLAADMANEAESERSIALATLPEYLERGVSHVHGGDTLAVHAGWRRRFARLWLRYVRATDRFLDPTAGDEVLHGVQSLMSDQVRLLVAGHTHGPRLRQDVRYINTGTWIPVGRLPPGDLRMLIDQLDHGPPWPAVSPRSCVRIDDLNGAPAGTLLYAAVDGTLSTEPAP